MSEERVRALLHRKMKMYSYGGGCTLLNILNAVVAAGVNFMIYQFDLSDTWCLSCLPLVCLKALPSQHLREGTGPFCCPSIDPSIEPSIEPSLAILPQ